MARSKNDTTEETQVEATQTEGTTAEAQAEKPIDLANFKSAVESAATVGVANNGTPDEASIEEVNKAYTELEGVKAKNAAKTFLREELNKAVDDGDMFRAKVMNTLNKDLAAAPKAKSGGGQRKAAAPVDPTDAYVQRRTSLALALALLPVPEGVAADHEERYNKLFSESSDATREYITWLGADKESRGDEPQVTDLVKQAAKLASAKKTGKASGGGGSTRTYSGPTRSIKKHIEQVFASVDAGTTLTVAQIAKASSEEYGDDHPSQGAISGALKSPKFDVAGVKPSGLGEGEKISATKV